MLEDKLLVWRLKSGNKDALRRIYERHRCYLLTVAANLLGDPSAAEDVVQDAFVSFIRAAGKFQLTGSIRGFLTTCVANRARDYIRRDKRRPAIPLADVAPPVDENAAPVRLVEQTELLLKAQKALTRLPYEQRETIVMRLHGGLRFRQIARLQNVSTKTSQSRYKYGLDKLRASLNGEVTK
jgi:RNA polymerase sigma-70 factor (ECF subfamily)